MNKTNLAFKCNCCNGGSDIDRMYYGYNGVCSEAVIKYKIDEIVPPRKRKETGV